MSQRIRTPRRADNDEPAVRRQRRIGRRLAPRRRGTGQWRLVSLVIVLLCITAGVIIFTNPIFYVTRAEIGGVRYVPAEEIFAQSGIANYHILWVDPDEVAGRVVSSPSLSSAQVVVQWPARVIIIVREREPALQWGQSGTRYWVDVNGNLMLMRAELPRLVHVVNEGEAIPFQCPGPACLEEGTVTIDPAVVQGAQQLKTLRPAIDVLYYDPVHGLSYQDGRGWRGYFGIGTDMNLKLDIYETLVADLGARGIQPIYINVSNPNAPFYRVAQ